MGTGSPFIAAFKDMASVIPLPWEMAEKDDTAISLPCGDSVCDGTSVPVNVFANSTKLAFFSFLRF